MPPMAIAIPVISRTPPGGAISIDKENFAKKLAKTARKYPEGPLPIKPSDRAPKNARITGRNLDDVNGVTYQLKIGDVSINNVGIEEILDYVSPLDLEEYENREFLQERMVLNVLEAEKEMERRAKLERQKERAKRKGTVFFEEVDSTEGVTEGGEDDVEVGRHGRARPTYTHLFKKFGPEKRRKRDPQDGDSMSISGEEGGVSTENEPVRRAATVLPSDPSSEVPKRRRRKRDKVTGELQPLSPIAKQSTDANQKRGRRRRHPETGELMPLGWRYDDEQDSIAHEQERDALSRQSFRKLSISQPHSAKRQRLDVESSASRSPSPYLSKEKVTSPPTPMKTESKFGLKSPSQNTIIDLMSSDDEPATHQSDTVTPKATVLKPLPMSATPKHDKDRLTEYRSASSSAESSPQPVKRTSVLQKSLGTSKSPLSAIKEQPKPSPKQSQTTKTSILNPSATRASSTEPSEHVTDEDDEDSEMASEADWYTIETILGHDESDPATHPPELGDKPVMLYLVKWEGFEELTWEPPESFGDPSIIQSYRVRVGLDPKITREKEKIVSDDLENEEDKIVIPTSFKDRRSLSPMKKERSTTDPKHNKNVYEVSDGQPEDDNDESEDAEYEVEAILAHHLSDPKTHPVELGQTPVLLYQVKWKGYAQTTWEPASSFADKAILQKYHERIGQQGVFRK